MNDFFHRIKHWQFFLLVTIPMFIIYFLMMRSMLSMIGIEDIPDPEAIFSKMKNYIFLMGLVSLIIYMWYWAVGVGLQSKIPHELRMNTTYFKIFLFVPLLYLVYYFSVMGDLMESAMDLESSPVPDMGYFGFVFIGSIAMFFIAIYMIYFMAKTIKTAQMQRIVTFNDFVGEFFLILFFPVGIWIIQPMINRVIEEEDELMQVE